MNMASLRTAAALDTLCLNHLTRCQRPRQYLFVPDLPKNNYAKVLQTDLRQRLSPAPTTTDGRL